MTLWILAVLALWVMQTMLPSSLQHAADKRPVSERIKFALGPRDEPPAPSALGDRAARALNNLQEAMPVFLTVALLLLHRGEPTTMATGGAALFFGARLLYVPAYLSAITGLRSLVWTVSWVGLGAMISQLWPLVG